MSYLPDQRCSAGLAWNLQSATREGTPLPEPIHLFQALLGSVPENLQQSGGSPCEHATAAADVRPVNRRSDPRASFPRDATAPWDDIQVAYFASYPIWNYLTLPFLLTAPGIKGCRTAAWARHLDSYGDVVDDDGDQRGGRPPCLTHRTVRSGVRTDRSTR